MTKITPAQRRKIWQLAKEKDLDEADTRDIVFQITKQQSISSMTIIEAIKVIDRLEGKNYKTATISTTDNQITKKQIWKINQIIQNLGWDDNPKRIKAFIKKYAKVDKIQWLTKRQAIKVIDGLKSILEKQAV